MFVFWSAAEFVLWIVPQKAASKTRAGLANNTRLFITTEAAPFIWESRQQGEEAAEISPS